MNKYNPLLLIDFYKACHSSQYPANMTELVSYYTPRMSRLQDVDKVTFFGLQAFIKEYLIDAFNENFFKQPLDKVLDEYNRILTYTLGINSYDSEKIKKLHNLQYLPLKISAVPEGSRTKIGVPQIEIVNTHPDFAWLVNTIETMLSCTMWHTQISAEVGYRYRQIVDYYSELTGSEIKPEYLLGDFSMRGQHSIESALKSSAAWLLSFRNTATVSAIKWLEDNYNCDCTKETVGLGAISTEHSVMCSNYVVDGDEITHIKRLLNEIYPNHSFSMVSDSYNYWNLVSNILPRCKEDVLNHNGTLFIRPDSGDPVEIIAGKRFYPFTKKEIDIFKGTNDLEIKHLIETFFGDILDHACQIYGECNKRYYSIEIEPNGRNYRVNIQELEPHYSILGSIWLLDQIFGSTVNEKGFKVLNPKIRLIYGDSITPNRCKEIYQRLVSLGYSIENIRLGVGSFSMMCLEEDTGFNPYTRDTFGIAIKSTNCIIQDKGEYQIFKSPKDCVWKKSQKGYCIVIDENNYTDNLTKEDALALQNINLLQPIFIDGKLVKEQTLSEIRNRLYPNIKIENILKWIKKQTEGTNGVVVGISGGKDSSIVAALCVAALGKDKVYGVLMPNGRQKDLQDAEDLCNFLNINYQTSNIQDVYNSLVDTVKYPYDHENVNITNEAKINIAPRIRMTILYTIAQSKGMRVVGTGNACERFVGYFTKWGDGACDFNPIGNLTVSEVISLGEQLRIPSNLLYKTPEDGLSGKTDEENLGVSYKEIEQVMSNNYQDIPVNKVKAIINRNVYTRHKREEIPIYEQ